MFNFGLNKLLIILCIFTMLQGFAVNDADAATFSAYASVGTCTDNPVSGSASQSATCTLTVSGPTISVTGTASASSGNGVLRAEATAYSFRDTDLRNYGTGFADGYAIYSDVLSIQGVSSGSILMPIDAFGNISGGGTVEGSFIANGTIIHSFSTAQNGVSPVSFGFSNSSSIGISATLRAVARACGILTSVPEVCVASSDYSNSIRLLGISVFDDFGNDVTGSVSVTSQSGFDYLQGATPHNPISPVPLPASLPLILAGLGSLALLRRRQG